MPNSVDEHSSAPAESEALGRCALHHSHQIEPSVRESGHIHFVDERAPS